MIQDGELLLIDMPEVTTGPALYDLTGIFRDMIVAPSGAEAASIERSVGLPKEMVIQVGRLFFSKYTGISGEKELEHYFNMLQLPNALNICLVVGTQSENAVRLAPVLMDKLLRGLVIPNEKALRQILSSAK